MKKSWYYEMFIKYKIIFLINLSFNKKNQKDLFGNCFIKNCFCFQKQNQEWEMNSKNSFCFYKQKKIHV